ncbi:MAG: GTP 3',8-cyclase MoaA [Flavitalea sp.]
MIKDTYNRIHDYLRISLTDNCNLRCFYCMPEEDYLFTHASKLMQPTEIETIAKIFVAEGVTKIRLTGGEPLVRKDAGKIIALLSGLPVQLALTTNGTRLHEFIDEIEAANISTINVSLDTLDSAKFKMLTRRDGFDQVFENIELFLSKGLHIKVNVVVMKGINDNEINDFVEWTKDVPVNVRFIEFMPFEGNKWSSNKVFTLNDLLERVAAKYSFSPMQGTKNDTAKNFFIPGHAGTFSVISTMTAPFCSTCNRMRLTADGKLKNCLFSQNEYDLLGPLRNGENIVPIIHYAIGVKAKETGGQFSNVFESIRPETIHNRSMISIGG